MADDHLFLARRGIICYKKGNEARITIFDSQCGMRFDIERLFYD